MMIDNSFIVGMYAVHSFTRGGQFERQNQAKKYQNFEH